MIWYKENLEEVYKILGADENGLDSIELRKRLVQYGPNQLAVKKDSIWRIILEPFRSVFIGVLLFAAFVSIISNEAIDALIIGVIITVNSIIFYTQQYATNRVLRSLKKHSIQKVNVLRDGREVCVSSLSLVPGDIVLLGEGERVPADCRVVHEEHVMVDESSLTGESLPIHKHSSTLSSDKQVYEQDNMLFQGTYITSGSARAIVVETGNSTEYAKIAHLSATKYQKSPVQDKIDRLIAVLVKVLGLVALLVFVLGLLRGMPAGEVIRFVLAMSVSAVPEGLPVALTVIIVLGMRHMARHKALVRTFKAIEDIGLVTTIATDKTGTLTKNHLKVIDSWSVSDEPMDKFVKHTIDPKSSGLDPLDVALNEYTSKLKKLKPKVFYPFELSLRMSAAYFAVDSTLYIKGAPEHVLYECKVTPDKRAIAESVMRTYASKGYRVIAFARKELSSEQKDLASSLKAKGRMEFIGFVAFADELRPEAAKAIKQAQEAGITVRMITGDHYETAYNIGQRLGLATTKAEVIQGTELPKSQVALAELIKDKTVFARILPEDKFRILKALKRTEITAMTGDGVNDVPALANAHVGIAMGSGSDIAKDAGGMVLLNNNFATIIKALSEGRRIYDNIRRMLFYLLSTSLGEVLTMIGALLLAFPLPVTAIQILWINIVTSTCMVLPLGMEPAESGHMTRPPRRPLAPLLNNIMLTRMILIGLTISTLTLITVYILKERGHETAYIQTVAFATLIAAQWMNAFNARSEYYSSFSRIKYINHGLIVGFLTALGLKSLVLFGPLQNVFGIVDVPLGTLAISLSIMGGSILGVSEFHKFVVRRIQQQNA